MLKRYTQLPVIIVLLVTVLAIYLLVHSQAHQTLPDSPAVSGSSNPLSVSQDGSQTTTNFSGADLQQAAPPAATGNGPNLGSTQVSP